MSLRRRTAWEVWSQPREGFPETELKEVMEAQRPWFRFSVHPHSNLGISSHRYFFLLDLYIEILFPKGNMLSLDLESTQLNAGIPCFP